MRVAFLNPPWRTADHFGVRAGSRWPHLEPEHTGYTPYPFYLGYAASLVEGDGFQAKIFDGCATRERDTDYLARVLSFSPDIIVQENATASIELDLRWAETLHEATKAPVLMTGHHVTQMKDALERYPFLDAMAGGEWEYAVLEYCQRIREGKSMAGVEGLIHRDAQGATVHEKRRPNIEKLDLLPFPHRSSLDMTLYHDNPCDLPTPMLQLLGSRGCPYKCDFCVWPQVVYEDNKYRTRSAKNMADEIEQCFPKEGSLYKSYYFDDDTFNIGDKRMCELADELIARRLDHIPWMAMCRADTSKKATLESLRRSGLAVVKYGVESGNQQIVDRIQKRLDIGELRDMVRFSHDIGLRTHLTFSFGHIGETQDTMRETLDLVLELNPTSVQFSIATPFPGTRFYDYAKKNNLLKTLDYRAYDGMSKGVIRTEQLTSEELEDFIVQANAEWDARLAGRHLTNTGYPSAVVRAFNYLPPSLRSVLRRAKAV